jgi:hypothetical protein
MAKKAIKLKKVSRAKVKTFKIKNRKGFAVTCMNNLTEGRTVAQANARMNKALKRIGCTL